MMLVSLYTSRMVLSVLGVENYGIYNVVGGIAAMFVTISGTLSGTISRFITFELGRNDKERLQRIFSTSVNVQIGFSLLVMLIGETVGVWFLNNKMDIPSERMYAANWVLQCSLIAFCINMISIPYNALIIAHEKMSAFAYIGITEAIFKLLIVYALYISPFDELISYSILTLAVSIIIRLIYGSYCKQHFSESKYSTKLDTKLLKEISKFAGWGFLPSSTGIINTTGINILTNLFFGVTVNAARGISTQVKHAVCNVTDNITNAISPQITKNYAADKREEMKKTIYRSSKFSYFLFLLLALPIMMETDYILNLWLKETPGYTVIFIRLEMLATTTNMLGYTSNTACMATGNVKNFFLITSLIEMVVFPVTWLFFHLGYPPYTPFIAYIFVYIIVLFTKLLIMKSLLNFPVILYVKEVLARITYVTICAVIIPIYCLYVFESSFLRFILIVMVCTICTSVSIYFLGLTKSERLRITNFALKKIRYTTIPA